MKFANQVLAFASLFAWLGGSSCGSSSSSAVNPPAGGSETTTSTGSAGAGGQGGSTGGAAGGNEDSGTPAEQVKEFVIPQSMGCNTTTPYPHDPAVDERNGIVYYVDSDNSCVGRYDPSTMQWTAWATPTPGSRPHGLTVAPDGQVFYTAQSASLIGRLDPVAGMIVKEYPVMTDPHTPIFHMGAVWFTSQQGNRYGRLDPASGAVNLYNAPTESSQPYGVDDAPNGHLWIALFGTYKLGELDPTNPATLQEHLLPDVSSRPRRIAVDKNGVVWYGDYSRDRLGMYNPATMQHKDWPTPSPMGLPYAIGIGPDGRVWYNDDGASLMAAFDPLTEMTQTVAIPTRGSTVRNFAVDTPRRRIWLALSGTGRLGMIQL